VLFRSAAEQAAAEQAAAEQAAAEQAAAEQAAAERAAAAAALARPVVPATPAETLVMVADDSKVVRVKTSRALAKFQYRVVLAEDGFEAMKRFADETPHVLITDVEMPGMDGFELTRHVRGNPATRHVPIVMITSSDDKHRAVALEAGVSVLLGKPYEEEALVAHIETLLGRQVPAVA
jgi:PleD family two-component response regulator